ncbi:MAG: class I SAM-dependent methyltransferase [Anaerolineae bacterium]|nr:class I SAM-dependent methyltransferase [Anaerolineae bacterium]
MLSLDQQNRLREAYRARHPGWQPATELYAGLVRRYMQPESRLLDLGCGRGGLVEQLEHPLRQIVGIDPDLASLREHRLPLPRAQATSARLPLARDSVDIAFASWLLEHLADPAADFAELARVLRPGGVFIFVTPNRRHPLALLNRLLGRAGQGQRWLVRRLYGRTSGDTFPAYYRANSRPTIASLAAREGLQLVQLEAIEDPTYLAFTPTLFTVAQRLGQRLPPERRLHLVGALASKKSL